MSPSRIVGVSLLLGGVLLVASGGAWAQTAMSTEPPGLTPRELADPLEPWSLEPRAAALPPPPAVVPDTTAAQPEVGASLPGPAPAALPAEESEIVQVVKCRQLLVSNPRQAERLAGLLHTGASLEDARRALGTIDVDESTRQYALEDLQPGLRAEIDSLSPGTWSRVRDWHGRSALFQVVSKEDRERQTIPALGEGLDPAELERLASRQRSQAARTQPPAGQQAGDVQPAAAVEKATPQYPEGVTESADVSVQVEVGLSDDYVGARVLNSTNSLFDQPALDAAQRSTYKSARRNGIPERGSVTINFHFVAPGQGPPPAQGQHPPD